MYNIKKLLLLRGIPGSGKSTWIKENHLEAYTLSSDHIRTLYQAPCLNRNGEMILCDYEGKKVNVYVKDLCQNGVVLKVTVCTKDLDDNFTACSYIRKEIKSQFDKNNIKICFKRIKVIN